MTSSSAISRGVVCPHPYRVRASSRPGTRELTRVESNPCAPSHSLIVAPPTSPWSQSDAVLSLVVIIISAALLSGIVAESSSAPMRSCPS